MQNINCFYDGLWNDKNAIRKLKTTICKLKVDKTNIIDYVSDIKTGSYQFIHLEQENGHASILYIFW
jgi:hypothetical protein